MVDRIEIECAKNVNLIEFLTENYPHLIYYDWKRKSYRHIDHDSLVINPEFWYRFSIGRGGDPISFLMEFCNKTFQEAVKELCLFSDISCTESKCDIQIKREDIVLTDEDIISEDFCAPLRKSNANNVIRYLQDRGISLNTINILLEQNLLYEDHRKNCVFYRKNPQMCILRGTGEEKWIKIIREIPNTYWVFKVGENSKDIFICESPIDAVSLYECLKGKDGYYCAMAGLKKRTYLRIIEDLGLDDDGILCKNIKIAVDWDAAGANFLDYEIDDFYPFLAVRPSAAEMKMTKDWNDVLCLRKNLYF